MKTLNKDEMERFRRGGRPPGVKNKTLEEKLPAPQTPRLPGQRVRPEHQDEVRAKIQAGALVRRLQDHASGLIEMTPTQIKAAEILLSKSLSSLQAVEINNVGQNDKLSEAEIIGKIAALMAANPQLRSVVTLDGVARVVQSEPAAAAFDEAAGCFDSEAGCPVCGDLGMPGGCAMCGMDGEGAAG